MAQLFDLKFKIRSIKIHAGLISGRPSAARFLIAMWRAPELARACASSDLQREKKKKKKKKNGDERSEDIDFFFFFCQRPRACVRAWDIYLVTFRASPRIGRHATCSVLMLRCAPGYAMLCVLQFLQTYRPCCRSESQVGPRRGPQREWRPGRPAYSNTAYSNTCAAARSIIRRVVYVAFSDNERFIGTEFYNGNSGAWRLLIRSLLGSFLAISNEERERERERGGCAPRIRNSRQLQSDCA